MATPAHTWRYNRVQLDSPLLILPDAGLCLVRVGVAAPALVAAARPRGPAHRQGVRPAVPLARGLQHAARHPLEPPAADRPLAQAGVPHGSAPPVTARCSGAA